MVIIYQELLPEAYLLVLAAVSIPETELARHLSQAAQSDRSAIWVDCRLLNRLPPDSACLLRHYHYSLQQHQRQLVLCRVSDGLARSLQAAVPVPTTGFLLANSLDEAAVVGWLAVA